jgi:transposase InsO family protein
MSLQARETVEKGIMRAHVKTGLPVETLLKHAGISKRAWHEWALRRGVETAHNNDIPKKCCLTPREEEAITAYCLANPMKGHRVLSYEMVDSNIAFVSPSTVYNVIKRNNLVKKRAETAEMKKKGFDQPAGVHERWHIDFSCVKTAVAFYYFLGILDGYSRKMLAWKLCETMMEGVNAEVLVTKAKELYPETKSPRITSGNGSQFVSRDFKELMSYLEFGRTFASANHPQSNGKLERFNRSLKTEHVRRAAYLSYEDAREKMADCIAHYDGERPRSAVLYLPRTMYFTGARSNGLQNAMKNCILQVPTGRNTGGRIKPLVPDTPY